MSNILNQTSVAAGGTEENLVNGSAFEFAQGRTLVSMGVVADQAGGFVTIQAGGNVVAEEFPCPVDTSGAYPLSDQRFYFQFAMRQGDRLVVRARNTAGTATVFSHVVAMAAG